MEFMNRFEIVTKDMVEKVPIIYIFTKSEIKDILNFDINLVKNLLRQINLMSFLILSGKKLIISH